MLPSYYSRFYSTSNEGLAKAHPSVGGKEPAAAQGVALSSLAAAALISLDLSRESKIGVQTLIRVNNTFAERMVTSRLFIIGVVYSASRARAAALVAKASSKAASFLFQAKNLVFGRVNNFNSGGKSFVRIMFHSGCNLGSLVLRTQRRRRPGRRSRSSGR